MAMTKCSYSPIDSGRATVSMAFTYAVALTGSIATGKSTVVNFFSSWGFAIIDADSIAHEILNEEHKAIASLFGNDIVREQKVDRKRLGNIVFSDTKKRQELEALLHPLIYRRIETLSGVLDKQKKPYLVDIPLFFEGNRYPIEKVLVVYTPPLLQLERLMQREAIPKEEAQKRINIQISIEEKRKLADYVIDNSGTLAALERECEHAKEAILGDFR